MKTEPVTCPHPPSTTTVSPPPQITATSYSSLSKGKLKLEQVEDELTCGICLSEGGKDIISRGWINSCDHYFCFVCIMEWSKLESKCPLCKRRFSSIRRPPKPGVFLSERVVNVPVRDQVYHQFGNVSVGPPYAYSDIKCSVCQSGTDDSLLLLCDLCDSASHTYCVGLGNTVPEVDWFCSDCTLLRTEHAMNETQADDQSGSDKSEISRIVQDPCIIAIRRYSSSAVQASTLNTRTLRRCHNVHDRIRVLRENWTEFRSGSLSFASTKIDSGAIINQKPGSRDITKAWKMMKIAKSIEGRKRTRPLRKSLCHPLKKKTISKEADGMSSTPLSSEGYHDLGPQTPQKYYPTRRKDHTPDNHKKRMIIASPPKPPGHALSSFSEINRFDDRVVRVENSVTNDAKSEIQSLVKINLNILTKDNKLDVDAFKRIAWIATHSILAACGLEHPKPENRHFPSSICRHADEIHEMRRSLLMPNSCRECFYLFVKNVVNTIMFESRGGTTTN